jgi:glycosyltransferase involved in cell wall biosynthesis
MSAAPRISIITSSYNCAPYLAACIRSVLGQTEPSWEHLIADCGSTDGSAQVLQELQHSRLRVFACEKIPVTEARNLLIREARGEFVAVLDADDTCMPGRFAQQLAALDADPSLVAVGAWVRLWYEQTGLRKPVRYPTRPQEIARLYAAGVNIIPHSTLLARREVVLRLGCYDANLRKAEDYDLIHQLTRVGRVRALPEHLVEYCMRNQEIDPVIRQKSIELNKIYVAYSMLRLVAPPAHQPPFTSLGAREKELIVAAGRLIARACWKGIFSPDFTLGWRCRLLLSVRLTQALRHDN